jgi:hypothetical protein
MSDAFAPDLGPLAPETLPVARGQPGYQPPAQPQRRGEPFIPSLTNRPYSEWGKPDFALQGAQNYPGVSPGPFMPQVSDLPGLIHGAVMGLGRWGSRYSGMPAIAMGTYATAFLNAYNKGLKERAAQNYQQYRQARQMTLDRQTEENQAYAEVYAEYHDESGKITDTNAFAQALRGVANKYHDDKVINALGAGNFGMIDRLLGARDSVVSNLQKAAHQEERQRLQDENLRLEIEERKKRLKGGDTDPGWEPVPPTSSTTVPPDTTAPATATRPDTTEPPDATADASSDTGATPAAPRAPATTGQARGQPSIQPPTAASRIPAATDPRIQAEATNILRGQRTEDLPKREQSLASAEAARQQALLNDIINQRAAGQLSPEAALGRMRKVNPLIAQEIEAMGNYDRPVPTGGIGASGIYASLEPYVKAAFPNYNAALFKYVDDVRNERSPIGQQIRAVSNMAEQSRAIYEALRKIPEGERPPKGWLDNLIAGKITGDARWAALGTSFLEYINEAAKVTKGGGQQITEGDRKRMLDIAGYTQGPEIVRQVMISNSIMASGILDAADRQFRNKMQRPDMQIPGYPEQGAGWIKAIASLDAKTGQQDPRFANVPIPDDLKQYLGPAGQGLKQPPKVGEERGGYRFKGGNPGDPKNWEKQ